MSASPVQRQTRADVAARVAALLREGVSTNHIADRLGVSRRTVQRLAQQVRYARS